MSAPPRLGRSIGAVVLGFAAVVILSIGTDQILHVLKIYPPLGEPMRQSALNALALSYRIVFGIAGGYIMARFAPYAPVRHAIIGGVIGLAISTVGAIATIPMNLGPAWYPIALAATSLPCSWLGGLLYREKVSALTAPASRGSM